MRRRPPGRTKRLDSGRLRGERQTTGREQAGGAPVPPGASAQVGPETAAGDEYVTPTGSPARAPRAGDCPTSPAEINGVPGRPRCHAAQPEERQLRAAPQSIGSDYGAERLGEIFPRLR